MTGPDATRPDGAGPELAGPELTGPEPTGPELAGTGAAGLPRTWRLRRAAVVPVLLAAVLAAATAAVWAAFPDEVRSAFSWPQLATVLAVLALVLAVLVGFAASAVTARADGVVVRNVLRVRRAAWADVAGLRYRSDDPWPVLLLADGTQFGLLGMQRADGPRSRAAAEALADVVLAVSAPGGGAGARPGR